MDIFAERRRPRWARALFLFFLFSAGLGSPGCRHPQHAEPASAAPAPSAAGTWPFTLGALGASFVAGTVFEGGVVVTGESSGALPPCGAGVTFSGRSDAVLVGLTSCGRCLWMRAAGTAFDDVGTAVAAGE